MLTNVCPNYICVTDDKTLIFQLYISNIAKTNFKYHTIWYWWPEAIKPFSELHVAVIFIIYIYIYIYMYSIRDVLTRLFQQK